MINYKHGVKESKKRPVSGFSLPELLVTISIMSISLTAMLSMFSFFNQQLSDMQSKFGIITLTNDFQSLATSQSSSSACFNSAFNGIPSGDWIGTFARADALPYGQTPSHPSANPDVGTGQGAPLVMKMGKYLLKSGAELNDYSLKVESAKFKLFNPNSYNINYIGWTNTTYYGYVEVTLRKFNDNASGGVALKPRTLGNFALKTNNAGTTIVSCIGTTSEEFRCINSPSPPNWWNGTTCVNPP